MTRSVPAAILIRSTTSMRVIAWWLMMMMVVVVIPSWMTMAATAFHVPTTANSRSFARVPQRQKRQRWRGSIQQVPVIDNHAGRTTTSTTSPTRIISDQVCAATVQEESTQSSSASSTPSSAAESSSSLPTATATTTTTTPINGELPGISTISTMDDIPIEELLPESFMKEVELAAEQIVEEMMDETCEVDTATGLPVDEICVDEEKKRGFRATMKSVVSKTLQLVRGSSSSSSGSTSATTTDFDRSNNDPTTATVPMGEILERGWEKRANSSALIRNAEVWKFALASAFRVLKARKLRKKGGVIEEEIRSAQTEAAEFIRDGLLVLGPSFVKLGQVLSTRTDVLPETYTDVLKTLTDEVPGFSGQRAKQIVSAELGKPYNKVFASFSDEPLKAASLGQVHTAFYKGKKVAIKVQRAGLKDLFDVDLKNLKKLAVLLDKFDPKSDGADRDWVGIYEESEKQLYREIDYLNEADNAERFASDFTDIDWVRIPRVYREVSTPRVLVMEYVDAFKLTDANRIRRLGLDRKLLARRVADSFLRQVVETGYFHADPHSGNLCVDDRGNLVFYDFGQMDELKPNVRRGFRTFCTALFAGGPKISETQLARNAKDLVRGVEEAGVLSKGADRLAVEKLARYFMRTFKDSQLGKSSGDIKSTIGPDLQTLTENNSFRFPSTFTFVFRAFVSVEGIGKELDPEFDIGKLAQPFIEDFIDAQKGYKSDAEKSLSIFQKATGLNVPDIETALMQPRKVAYIEETLRSMENGTLKIRVRSLENEKALERQGLKLVAMENIMMASVLFNVAGIASKNLVRSAGIAGACFFLLQSLLSYAKIKKFDKTQAKYVNSAFVEDTAPKSADGNNT